MSKESYFVVVSPNDAFLIKSLKTAIFYQDHKGYEIFGFARDFEKAFEMMKEYGNIHGFDVEL